MDKMCEVAPQMLRADRTDIESEYEMSDGDSATCARGDGILGGYIRVAARRGGLVRLSDLPPFQGLELGPGVEGAPW